MLLKASKSDPPVGSIIVCKVVEGNKVKVDWGTETSLDIGDGVVLSTGASIIRYLSRSAPQSNLYGDGPLTRTEVDHWLSFTLGHLASQGEFKNALDYLETAVKPDSFLVNGKLSAADYAVFGGLFASGQWQGLLQTNGAQGKVLDWYKFIGALPEVKAVISGLPKDTVPKAVPMGSGAPKKGGQGAQRDKPVGATKQTKDEGKFVDLPGAEQGKVVVRFPPEASGFLHIGHAKAAMLNQHYRDQFQGKLVLRFDDTNPAKEKEEFEEVILHDLKLLQVKHDHFSRTSDHFELMLTYCEKMIKEGNAYVDDTDAETMKAERESRTESKNRSNSAEKNLSMWVEMKNGSARGQTCAVRAKMNMLSDNGCMRDPTIYRCKPEPHPSTGTKYKVYPTYDFACPIVDSIEGITHALRTTEYMDRDEQFFWFIDALGLRKPHIYAYSRLSMTNTVMSKRKLAWFVDNNMVDGWDDPRFPTVRGIIRRGLTIDALKQFIIAQGSSRSVVFMEWDKIWSMNKKIIDPVAPRFTAVNEKYHVPVHIEGVVEEAVKADKHPKDPSIGQKTVWRSSTVLIDGEDAEVLKEGINATFINWGNITIKSIKKEGGKIVAIDAVPDLDNRDYKKTIKVTWLAKTPKADFVPTTCVYYDHIISKPVLDKEDDFKQFVGKDTKTEIEALGDPELSSLKKGDVIQIQRRGFFIVDSPYKPLSPNTCKATPIVLISIPDGTPGSYGPPGKAQVATKAPATAAVSAKPAKGSKKSGMPAAPAGAASNEGAKPTGINADAAAINATIANQGELVRKLKVEKAPKGDVDVHVKVLLELKARYKAATGQDWKPGCTPPAASAPAAAVTAAAAPARIGSIVGDEINNQIGFQGDKIRKLKGEKAPKGDVDVAVKVLLDLKAKYKAATGQDWKPGSTPPDVSAPGAAAPAAIGSGEEINDHIGRQGDKIRKLKGEKAEKKAIDEEVQNLLALKAKYKEATGKDWKPCTQPAGKKEKSKVPEKAAAAPTASGASTGGDANSLNDDIAKQGDLVRHLKADKASKAEITAAVAVLLDLKAKFKTATGSDWKPGQNPPAASNSSESKESTPSQSSDLEKELNDRIVAHGELVRKLKGDKADKADIDANVQILLGLKAKYKEKTGGDWKPAGNAGSAGGGGKGKKEKKPQQQPKKKEEKKADSGQKQTKTRLGVEAKKEENLSDWYSQVIVKAEMLEYYDVSGCYILRPWSYNIWEIIQKFLDAEIKKLGVENCYFPIFVSQAALEREKAHIADFAPEVAWVTKSGDSELAEPIAVRPTSETVMYPAYAKWIQSYRDLPLKLNQWNNVVRWEFKHPQPFLRTREFLWQEGHTAFASKPEAEQEVLDILDLYRRVYEEIMAIPTVPGRKTEKEKFAGGEYTATVEAYITAAGRAIQGATSHHLGQNFAKMFEVVYEHPESGEKQYVYQNSWGMTTRTIGVLTMVHGDNQGLVLPPKVASVQVVIVPCGITANLKDEDRSNLYKSCEEYEDLLKKAGVKVKGDYRENYSPGWKYNHWELKGVPIRIELGPRDIKNGEYVAVRRDTGEKLTMKKDSISGDVAKLLDTIQSDMFAKAKKELDEHISVCDDWQEFVSALDKSHLIMSPFCGIESCEDSIKDDSKGSVVVEEGAPSMGAKSLCIPFKQPKALEKGRLCVHTNCKKEAKFYTLFGRSY